MVVGAWGVHRVLLRPPPSDLHLVAGWTLHMRQGRMHWRRLQNVDPWRLGAAVSQPRSGGDGIINRDGMALQAEPAIDICK